MGKRCYRISEGLEGTSRQHKKSRHSERTCCGWSELSDAKQTDSWLQPRRKKEGWNCEKQTERERKTSTGDSAVTGSRSVNVMFTKNEPVVGRYNHHRAGPWEGAKLTPWLWAGGTKEVRTSAGMQGDPGRHGRCAAIDGRVYTRPCKTKNRDVLFRIP